MSIFDKIPGLGGGSGTNQSAGGFLGSGGKTQTQATATETRTGSGQAYADRGGQAISGFQLQDTASVHFNDLGLVDKTYNFLGDAVKTVLGQSSANTAAAASAFQNAQHSSGGVNADTAVKIGMVGLLLLAGVIAYVGSKK